VTSLREQHLTAHAQHAAAHAGPHQDAGERHTLEHAVQVACSALDPDRQGIDIDDDRPDRERASDLLVLIEAGIEQSPDPEGEVSLTYARDTLRRALNADAARDAERRAVADLAEALAVLRAVQPS